MIDWFCQALNLPQLTEERAGFVAANGPAAEALGGRPCPNLVTGLQHLVDGEVDAAKLAGLAAEARAGKRVSFEVPGGERLLFAPAGDGFATVVVAPAAVSDASVARRARAADRAAAMSHELANALGAIAGWAELAQQGHRVDEALLLIERSARSAWDSAKQALGEVSGRRESNALAYTDLSAFMDEVSRLLTPKALEQEVEIRTRIAPGLGVPAERSQLWSIVWNLAINAIEAMAPGGQLGLEADVDPEGRVRVAVEDTGPGMDEATRARIFDRYFSTKETGSGLGLGVTRRTVEALGGRIDLRSAPGQGSRFEVTLPRADAPATGNPRATTKRSSGVYLTDPLDARVLVVDDDAVLRDMVVAALELRGARVETATGLADALDRAGPFDVVLVDLRLGDERGDEVVAQLRQRGRAARALLMTGTELPEQLAPGGRPDGVLRKPFELDTLFEQVAAVLETDGENSAAG